VAGRKVGVVVEIVDGGPVACRAQGWRAPAAQGAPGRGPTDLREAARGRRPAVQAILEIFPAEVKDVTELKDS